MKEEHWRAASVTCDEEKKKSSHELARASSYGAMSDAQDREALALLKRGDPRGFDAAYARYAQRIFSFLVRLSRSRVVAEDLFQHTFLRLAEAGPLLRPDSDLRAWLFSVARNAYFGHFRARRVEARTGQALGIIPETNASRADSGVALGELERALGGLPPESRELLLLVGIEGMSPAEVGRILNIDQVAVRKRVSRARARLARALDEGRAGVAKSKLSQ